MLHSRNAKIVIENIHQDFIVPEVVRSCNYCSDQIIHRRFTGPLVHASLLTRERICNELILVINDGSVLEYNCFKNAPLLDPTTLIPETVDTIYPAFNCVCAALSTILTGKPNKGR